MTEYWYSRSTQSTSMSTVCYTCCACVGKHAQYGAKALPLWPPRKLARASSEAGGEHSEQCLLARSTPIQHTTQMLRWPRHCFSLIGRGKVVGSRCRYQEERRTALAYLRAGRRYFSYVCLVLSKLKKEKFTKKTLKTKASKRQDRKQNGNMRVSDLFVPHVKSRNPLYVYLHIDANVTYCANECSFSVVVPLVVWVLSDCTRM